MQQAIIFGADEDSALLNGIDALETVLQPFVDAQTLEYSNSRCYLFTLSTVCDANIVLRLQIEPKTWLHSKKQSQSQSSIGSNGSLAMHEIAYSAGRNIYISSKLSGSNFHRLHEIFKPQL